MSLLFADGFDSYGQTSDLLLGKKWASNTGWTWSATAGRLGGGGLLLPATTGKIAMFSGQLGLAITSAVCCGFWFKASAPPAAAIRFVEYFDSTGVTFAGGLGINTSGQFQLLSPSNVVQFAGSTNVCDGQWHWVEWYYQPWNSSSPHKCYVDSVQQWNTTLAFSANGTCDFADFNVSSAMTVNLSWPLFYGNAAGNPVLGMMPLGPQMNTTLRPVSDGPCTFGTVSSGAAHWDMVNDTVTDGDATYVEGLSGTGLQDLYNYSAVAGAPTILTVVLNTMLDNPSGGTANYQTACKSGAAAVALGASIVAPATYAKMDQRSIANDPNTSAAWTAAGLNAAQFGVKAV